MKSLILISSLFVIGVFGAPIDTTKNEVNSEEADVTVYTWPAVKGVVYEMRIADDIPFLGIKIIDKSLDNNPEGSTFFLKSNSIKFNVKTDKKTMQNMEYATSLLAHGSKIMAESPVYSFENNILKVTIPDIGTVQMKVLSDASIQATVVVNDDEGNLVETSFILSIMDFAGSEYFRSQGPTFTSRIMVENPDVSLDVYLTDEFDLKVKFNAKDVIFDTNDIDNSFPFNLMKQFEETEKIPLTLVMAISKY